MNIMLSTDMKSVHVKSTPGSVAHRPLFGASRFCVPQTPVIGLFVSVPLTRKRMLARWLALADTCASVRFRRTAD